MNSGYWLAILVLSVLIFGLFVGLLLPNLEGPLLRAWYARQRASWITTAERRVDGALETFVRSRYVRVDAANGRVEPRDCSAYLHVFPFTDSGRPVVVRFTGKRNALVLTERETLSYRDIRDLALREYVDECLENIGDWPRLFRSSDSAENLLSISALRRYSYRIELRPRKPYSLDNAPPSASAALENTRNAHPKQLVVTFTDDRTKRSYEFVLTQFTLSALATSAKTGEDSRTSGDLWSQLPTHALARSNERTHDARSSQQDTKARDVVLFSKTLYRSNNDTDSSLFSTDLNPCWNASTNRWVTGDFPVTAAQFSNIYMRGLQQVSSGDVVADPKIAANLKRLYWRCVWDYENDGSSRERDDSGGGDLVKGNSLLYDTLLSLRYCENGSTCV